ncbi:hypothetical protein HNQ59_001938 [Chitinivorax tropicus]|uniref:Uncharacterized protein n=1 Tax=Chitinivorax tropicus TaxID=714531 RepID=A0A840MNR2_9PROT|nr:hypothetical protein [Chitinivorax tropicus]
MTDNEFSCYSCFLGKRSRAFRLAVVGLRWHGRVARVDLIQAPLTERL